MRAECNARLDRHGCTHSLTAATSFRSRRAPFLRLSQQCAFPHLDQKFTFTFKLGSIQAGARAHRFESKFCTALGRRFGDFAKFYSLADGAFHLLPADRMHGEARCGIGQNDA